MMSESNPTLKVHEDVCVKVVRYCRANIIGNEKQGLALFLCMMTAFSPDVKEFTPVVILGELSSGKTHLVKIILGDGIKDTKSKYTGLFPHSCLKHVTSTSPKATIYDRDLRENDRIKIIVLAEYQKLDPATLEWLKSQSGDDAAFAYEYTDMTVKDVGRIEQPKRVFVMTFAQLLMDGELKSRMVSYSVEENKRINKCVNMMNHGKPYAEYRGIKYTLEGDEETAQEIRDIVGMVAAEDGGLDVVNPFWAALEDLEDCSRASSKRISRMIEAMFRASARVNWENRVIDDDEKIVMSRQDIVNAMSFADILQSMVLEIDVIDLAIVRYLSQARGAHDATDIIARIDESGLAELKGSELSKRMEKLENDNYVGKIYDPDKKRNKWYRNRRKHVHPLTVYWDKLAEVDDGPVVDPITGMEFDNVLEYGEWFDKTYTVGLDDDESTLPEGEEPDGMYMRTWVAVETLLSSGQPYCSAEALKRDCRSKLGMTGLDSFTEGNTVDQVVQDMLDKNIIELDKSGKRFVMLDPSVRNV